MDNLIKRIKKWFVKKHLPVSLYTYELKEEAFLIAARSNDMEMMKRLLELRNRQRLRRLFKPTKTK